MKKVLSIVVLMCLLVLSGCKGYTRDSDPGEINVISVAQMEEKVVNEESFAIMFTQSWCSHCELVKKMLVEYLKDHHVVLYEVIIDQDPNPNRAENIDTIQSYFTDMDATPTFYYVEDGKPSDKLIPDDDEDGLSETKFDSWVQRYQLDEKK